MFTKDIWRFGAVDVQDEFGLVRHGIVRDITRDGSLIVNFDHPRHRTELVPVSACVKQIEQFPPSVGEPVEALYQYRRDQPWRWWPAELVMLGSYNEYAIIEIVFNAQTIQEIVPMERVRVPMPYVPQFSSRTPFYKHGIKFNCLDPQLTRIIKSDKFALRWERETEHKVVRLHCVDRMQYLSGCDQPLFRSECKEYLLRIGSAEKTSSCVPDGDIGSTVSGEISTVSIFPDDLCLEELPGELIFEVFSYLKTNEQMLRRRTCRSWNCLLTAWKPRLVQIDLGWLSSWNYRENDYYELAILLDRLVDSTTKSLILIGNEDFNWSRPNIYHIVIDMLKRNDVKVSMLVICNGSISAYEMLCNWRTSYLKSGNHADGWDVCRKLALVNVKIALPLHKEQRSEGVLIQREIVDKNSGLVESMMKKLCTELKSSSVPQIEATLKKLWEMNANARLEISLILKAFQVGDSRFAPTLLSSQGDFVRMPILPSVGKLTGKVLLAYSIHAAFPEPAERR